MSVRGLLRVWVLGRGVGWVVVGGVSLPCRVELTVSSLLRVHNNLQTQITHLKYVYTEN